MKKSITVLGLLLLALLGLLYFSGFRSKLIGTVINENTSDKTDDPLSNNDGGLTSDVDPLAIAPLKKGSYPGSDIVIEEILEPGSNYNRYLTSYKSEGLKIYALLTIPQRDPSTSSQDDNRGYPVIVFNHGFIPPKEYRTTQRYIAYVDGFARNGYIVFRSDYRGHGNSEGEASGGYGSNAYTIDVLNAVATLKREGTEVALRQVFDSEVFDRETQTESAQTRGAQGLSSQIVNHEKIGMWGHSMGGFITLRSMVVTKDIKAGVIWAGVVGSYPDMINNWRRRPDPYYTPPPLPSGVRRWRQALVERFGEPSNGSPFWQSISANFFLSDISGSLSLHHGTSDESVPMSFSQTLSTQMKAAGKEVELYIYEGDDHNLSANFSKAMQRSIEFFDRHLKN